MTKIHPRRAASLLAVCVLALAGACTSPDDASDERDEHRQG